MRIVVISLLSLNLSGCATPGGTPSPASSGTEAEEARNKQLAREFTDVIYNHQKFDRLAEFVAPDFIDHSPGAPPPPHGVEMVRKQAEGTYTAFPDLKFEVAHLLAEDDLVLIHWISRGTHGASIAAGDPKPVVIEGQSLFRYRNGKIVESWDIVDRAGMFKQLGFKVTPPEWMKPAPAPTPNPRD